MHTLIFQHFCVFQILVVLVLCTAGCGGTSSFPEGPTGTLSGTVTLDGAPAPTGTTIALIHDKTAQPAVAVVKEGGAYEASMRGEPKVLAGSYKVSLADPPQPTMTDEQMAAIYEGKADATSTTSVVPQKYNSSETSGLTVEVSEGPNSFDIQLTKE